MGRQVYLHQLCVSMLPYKIAAKLVSSSSRSLHKVLLLLLHHPVPLQHNNLFVIEVITEEYELEGECVRSECYTMLT